MTEQRNVAAPSLPREYELSQMISGVVCAVQEYSESIPRGIARVILVRHRGVPLQPLRNRKSLEPFG